MELVVSMKTIDNCWLMVQLKTTLDSLKLASVLKEINHYEAQNVLTSDNMLGQMSWAKWVNGCTQRSRYTLCSRTPTVHNLLRSFG